MECNHTKADEVIVYTSLLSPETLKTVKTEINRWAGVSNEAIHICRVLDAKQKILVLLRNPYGDGGDDAFSKRIADMVKEAKDFAEKKESQIFESLKRYSAFNDINDCNDCDKKLKSFKNNLLDEFDNMCEKLKSDTNNRLLLEGNKTVEELIDEVIKGDK